MPQDTKQEATKLVEIAPVHDQPTDKRERNVTIDAPCSGRGSKEEGEWNHSRIF